jgi:Ca-activated chloride channel family protein
VVGGLTISDHLLERGINRVLLITDGQANVGITSTDEIVTQSLQLFQRGISTSTIGIGADFNEDLLLPMAQSGGGNAWHVVEPEGMQRIFQVELDGLVAQFAHTISLSLIPSDGIRVADVLNDFELTETGRYRLPNLQAGSSLDIVVQLKVGAQTAGSTLRLLDLRMGFTPQGQNAAEVVKSALSVEFVESNDDLAINHEVIKAVQFLMNARARREAMDRIDRGDYAGASVVIGQSIAATQVACAPFASVEAVEEECASLEEVAKFLDNRNQDGMSRKKLAYAAYSRRTRKSS